MKHILILSTILLFYFVVFGTLYDIKAQEISSPLIISEIMPNPAGSDSLYEWVELYNHSQYTIELADWKFNNVLLPSTSLSPDQFIILAKNKDALLGVYPDLQNVFQFNISLNNSSGTLELSNLQFIDSFKYNSSSEEISLERINNCSSDILSHPLANSLGQLNYSWDNSNCSENFIEVESSIDQINYQSELSGFSNKSLFLQVKNQTDHNPDDILWMIDDSLIGTGKEVEFIPESIGIYQLSISLFSETYQFTIEIYPSITINEIFPNAVGSDTGNEWIELYFNEQYYMHGWKISDNSDEFIIPDTNMNFYNMLYPDTVLGNTSDVITLYTPSGLISDQISYSQTSEGKSIARLLDGVGEWIEGSIPTPGTSNIISNTSNEIIKIADVKQLEENTLVSISGVVTSLPSQISKNAFYIQDNTGGIRISYKGDISNLEIGDKITLSGTIDIFHDEIEIDLNINQKLQILSSKNKVIAQLLTEIYDYPIGSLVELKGEITSISSNTFYIESKDSVFKVTLNPSLNSQITKTKGQSLQVTGILSQWGFLDDGTPNLRILPRNKEDITVFNTDSKQFTDKDSKLITANNRINKEVLTMPIFNTKSHTQDTVSMTISTNSQLKLLKNFFAGISSLGILQIVFRTTKFTL